jgi:hypothetical protein
MVVTGGWLSEKKVLMPEAFQKLDYESKTLSVNLTQEKIKKVRYETDKPVSEQQEDLIRGYYSWRLLRKRNVWTHGLRHVGIH